MTSFAYTSEGGDMSSPPGYELQKLINISILFIVFLSKTNHKNLDSKSFQLVNTRFFDLAYLNSKIPIPELLQIKFTSSRYQFLNSKNLVPELQKYGFTKQSIILLSAMPPFT
jgi:hypothetical protein